MNKLSLLVFLLISTISRSQKIAVDLLVFNAQIYTVDDHFSVKEAMVIRNGKIIATGLRGEELEKKLAEVLK